MWNLRVDGSVGGGGLRVETGAGAKGVFGGIAGGHLAGGLPNPTLSSPLSVDT